MAEYSIGDVEKLTGVKAHVLRYWEEAVPFIRPRKDDQGRRFYSSVDVEMIRRIRYFITEEKYTLEGAGERLIAERSDTRRMDMRDAIDALRADLLRVYEIVRTRETEGMTNEKE